MIRINIHEAKTHLSFYLKKLKKGEKLIVCKRNIPVAELILLADEKHMQKRPIGLAKGQFSVTDSFFEPLSDEIIDSFNGEK
jgi:antitoxin (DNA-binding transcriptional repressor) of toxin-antitoxin stability system